MGLSIHYRSTQPMHPALAFKIKQMAGELNGLYEWVGCEAAALDQRTDGYLQGSSATSFVVDADLMDDGVSANNETAGDIATLIDVLCELSRSHEVDWAIEHDCDAEVIGFIREGVADTAVIEELETIRTIGEMLGDFDDEEIDDDFGERWAEMTEAKAEVDDGPLLLKFPGLD